MQTVDEETTLQREIDQYRKALKEMGETDTDRQSMVWGLLRTSLENLAELRKERRRLAESTMPVGTVPALETVQQMHEELASQQAALQSLLEGVGNAQMTVLAMLERLEQQGATSVAASAVNEEQLQAVRKALNVQLVVYVPEGEVHTELEEVAAQDPEPDGFKWDLKVSEPQQACAYREHLIERVNEAINQLKATDTDRSQPCTLLGASQPVLPEAPHTEGGHVEMAADDSMGPAKETVGELQWKDAKGSVLTCRFEGAPFVLKAKNNEVLATKARLLSAGAILGVEMKKKVTPQMLLQMEAEYYTWDMHSMWPFCQLGLDGCRGGAALWYEGLDGKSHILRYQVFNSSAAVYKFAAKLILGLPNEVFQFKHKSLDDLQPGKLLLPDEFPSPKRRKLMGPDGSVYPFATGGLEPNSSSRGGGQGPGGGGQGPRGSPAAPQQGVPAADRAAGGSGTLQPGMSKAAEPCQPPLAIAAIHTQRAAQAAGDSFVQDQSLRSIPWASVNPVVRKVVQLLHEFQAEDDTAVLEDVDDPAPYLEGADAVAPEEPIPEAS